MIGDYVMYNGQPSRIIQLLDWENTRLVGLCCGPKLIPRMICTSEDSIEDIAPIPLTELVVKSLGFVKCHDCDTCRFVYDCEHIIPDELYGIGDVYCWISSEDSIYIAFNSNGNVVVAIDGWDLYLPPVSIAQSVHELQHLAKLCYVREILEDAPHLTIMRLLQCKNN